MSRQDWSCQERHVFRFGLKRLNKDCSPIVRDDNFAMITTDGHVRRERACPSTALCACGKSFRVRETYDRSIDRGYLLFRFPRDSRKGQGRGEESPISLESSGKLENGHSRSLARTFSEQNESRLTNREKFLSYLPIRPLPALFFSVIRLFPLSAAGVSAVAASARHECPADRNEIERPRVRVRAPPPGRRRERETTLRVHLRLRARARAYRTHGNAGTCARARSRRG